MVARAVSLIAHCVSPDQIRPQASSRSAPICDVGPPQPSARAALARERLADQQADHGPARRRPHDHRSGGAPRGASRHASVTTAASGCIGRRSVRSTSTLSTRTCRPPRPVTILLREVHYEGQSFAVDVLAYPRCGGRTRVIATIEDSVVIRKILTHLSLPTEVPAPRPPPRNLLLDA